MRPVRDDMDRGSAPLSAQNEASSVSWDHLGATRAEEYAEEDILDLCPGTRCRAGCGPCAGRAGSGSTWDAAQRHRDRHASAAAKSRGARPPMATAQPIPQPVQPRGQRKAALSAQSRRARWSYRLQRIWLTPFYRAALTRGLPLALVLGLCALVLANPQNRAQLAALGEQAYSAIV